MASRSDHSPLHPLGQIAELTLSIIIGKNTPTSAFNALRNFCSRLRKMDAESCRAAGMLLALFFSSDKHRYCRMAAVHTTDKPQQHTPRCKTTQCQSKDAGCVPCTT